MTTIHVNLVVEDDLSESVLRRLLRDSRQHYEVASVLPGSGFGYIKKRIVDLNRAAAGANYLVLTDLDTGQCAAALLRDWLPQPRHRNLLFRVAVREVEAWLLADRAEFASFLGVVERRIPQDAEQMDDPKAHLIALARRSRYRRVREDLVPAVGTTAKQGPGYNSRLAEFVDSRWDPHRAGQRSNSLRRLIERLANWGAE
jgi:hypothetical protein